MNTTDELLESLTVYAARFPEESEKVRRFMHFIMENADCFSRKHPVGHITASAWIVSTDGSKVLLAFHRKLKRWIQVGGHVETGESLIEAALREAREESGLASLRLHAPDIYDLDIHDFPAQTDIPAHLHFDVRFLMVADGEEQPERSVESREVAWIERGDIQQYTDEASVLRLAKKH